MKLSHLLLASHGTEGARAAEARALSLCAETGAKLSLLYVVPDFWKGMMGDDWLNNAASRIRFGKYVENQLAGDADAEIARIADLAEKRGIVLRHAVVLGKPAECLVEAAREAKPDLVVIGAPRPKGAPGYNSRMNLERLAQGLTAPLLIEPHPGR